MKKVTTLSLAALFAAFLSLSVQATENPFGVSDLQKNTQTAMSSGKCGGEGKCGEGKCGDDKKGAEKKDGKCGEGKCGGDKKGAEKKDGKCGEGKCGGDK